MIDYTLFWPTLALLLVGVAYACLCTHVAGGEEDRSPKRDNVVRLAARKPGRQGRQS